MLDQIAPELLVLPPEDAAHFTIARGALHAVAEEWLQREKNLNLLPTLGGRHVLVVKVLARCSDEAVAAEVSNLAFVKDKRLREVLRRDISSAKRSFAHGEWKRAPVMAGSAVEALLLWVIETRHSTADRQKAVQSAPWSTLKRASPTKQLDRWGIAQLSVPGN